MPRVLEIELERDKLLSENEIMHRRVERDRFESNSKKGNKKKKF